MSGPPKLLNADIEENLKEKMNSYICEDDWDKITIFTDDHWAEELKQLDHSVVYTEIPLVPIPAEYTPALLDQLKEEMLEYVVSYFSDRRMYPKCRFHVTGDLHTPQIHLIIYEKHSFHVSFKSWPFKVTVKPPALPEPSTAGKKTSESGPSPKPTSVENCPPTSTSSSSSKYFTAPSTPRSTSAKSPPPSSITLSSESRTMSSKSMSVPWGSTPSATRTSTVSEELLPTVDTPSSVIDDVFTPASQSESEWSTRLELMTPGADDLSYMVEELPVDDPPAVKKSKEEK